MHPFQYVASPSGLHELHAEGVPLRDLADRFGTPLYVYSLAGLRERYSRLAAAFAPLSPTLLYAVKANGNTRLLRELIAMGSGLDVVSGGELERAWLAGAPMSRVSYAGVGKTEDEVRAALSGTHSPVREWSMKTLGRDPASRGPVGLFNIESEEEAARIESLARSLAAPAEACVRVNPDVDARTHAYTTTGTKENKFGVDPDAATRIFERFASSEFLRVRGVHMHLGSPIASPDPYVAGARALLGLSDRLVSRGARIDTINIGGGFGIDYGLTPNVAAAEEFARAIVPLIESRVRAGWRVLMEPGRCLVAECGVLLSRVQYVKRGAARTFAIGDAGMQTLIRPALYQATHAVWPVTTDRPPASLAQMLPSAQVAGSTEAYDVVGPICESSDFLCRQRVLPMLKQGDVLAVFTAGAYGMSMASTYNDHTKPAEVLIDNGAATLIRPHQAVSELFAGEFSI